MHHIYELPISSLDESFSLPVKVFSQEKICGNVPKISHSSVISELNAKGIILSDLEKDYYEINLLPGADDVGILFLDQSIRLKSGLFFLKTRQGFVLTGNEQVVYRHCRVVFGVSSSPFLLAEVLSHLLEHAPAEDSGIADKLKLSFYVNNCVAGVNDVRQQEEFILKARTILSRGCFNLRYWESNVECEYISKSTETTKVLGILWDLDKDVFKCDVCMEGLKSGCNITKRFILAAVQKMFDPLDILYSAILPPKILLQNTWKSILSWDSPLHDDDV
ncbi:uncharacterized protein NPIL_537931 [Nephila pilipes]|uniref:Reverse transcriptase domain-containing protein n=1 Tax=Nephila pilipes TaxID=299642 RepID=A0A8X6TV92_NEPPI|nr:uncharacterized protein NPIL_537931 [Nephila pilipes]